MTSQNPASRPNARSVLDQWHIVQEEIPSIMRLWRLQQRSEPWVVSVVLDSVAAVSGSIRLGRRFVNWLSETQV